MSRSKKLLSDQLAKNVHRAQDNARLYKLLPFAAIHPNPNQPRRVFDSQAIEELADSIRNVGLLNPIVVRSDGTLVAGERRYRACKIAGLDSVPVWVLPPHQDTIEVSLIENLQRKDLHPLEEAVALNAILHDGMTQEELGRRIGKSNVYISEALGLLRLNEEIRQEWFRVHETVTKYHMIQLSRLESSQQLDVWRDFQKKGDLNQALRGQPARRVKSNKPPRPQSVLSRIRRIRTFFNSVDTNTWQKNTRQKLKAELQETISDLRRLADALED